MYLTKAGQQLVFRISREGKQVNFLAVESSTAPTRIYLPGDIKQPVFKNFTGEPDWVDLFYN